jgi:hypothetical protein
MKLLGLALLSIGILASALAEAEEAAKSFPGIESLMSHQEFQAAGLDKLSPAEREALNSFLIRYTAEDAPVLLTTDEEVLQAVQEQEIASVIQQPFKGWSGDTVFRLENGQVWQQRRRGNYAYRGTHPEVLISRNFMGFFRMELVENGKAVQVTRIK